MRISYWISDVCSSDLISEPVKDNHQSRWRPFAAVGYWPKKSMHGQMHFRLSREKAPKAQVSLSIGARRFTLTAGGADAWAPDKRVDAAIIAAIRSGTSMSVQATGKNGAHFADVYALRGAATARSEERRVGKECVSKGRSRWSPDH